MILSKYNEIMARLTVSDEARERLIAGVEKADEGKSKVLRYATVKRIAAAAACFILLVAGFFIIKNMREDHIAPTAGGTYQTPHPPVEYENAAGLSEASGVAIEDLKNLPFEPTETVYRDCGGGLAEIVYSNGDEILNYRVSKGDEDNSGDYNEYTDVYQKEINGTVFTLKGEGELIYCALYKQGDYSYSITSTAGLTAEQIEKIVK